MKVHLTDTHLLVPGSRSPAKVWVKCECHTGHFLDISVLQTQLVHVVLEFTGICERGSGHSPYFISHVPADTEGQVSANRIFTL